MSEWISVDDRLPECDKWVLACGDGAMMTMGFIDGQWRDMIKSAFPNVTPESVTHWMPLPEPPKSATQEEQ